MKNVVIISDLHCGSIFGLTPAGWHFNKREKYYSMQKESWEAYLTMTKDWQKPDVLICNGDMIDGRQKKQGGAELITNDRNVQVDMATIAIKRWNAAKIFMTYGTTYHTSGEGEDFEYTIAQQVGAEIGGRLFINIEGIMFDVRHKIGTSLIPHGRGTSLLRAMMWNLMKSADKSEPKANIIVRSHAHYHIWIEQVSRIMTITPALQISRGRYGSRECDGETHWGAIRLRIDKGNLIGKDVAIWKLKSNVLPVIRVN